MSITRACRVAHRATATVHLRTRGIGDGLGGSGSGGVGVGGAGLGGDGFSGIDALCKRIAFTAAICRKLDKCEQSLR
jgi:hypothetical protein